MITYEMPEISENEFKPVSIANLSFPYTNLTSPRRFEELVYSLIKTQLGIGIFTTYDTITLMSGVSEQGRDCVLITNGKAGGIIQCKKYQANLGKDEFGKEITKFVLYSLLDSKLLPDPEVFTYFIAVSKGFTRECIEFIDDFSTLVLTEPKLQSWIDTNIHAFNTLAVLEIKTELLSTVKTILRKIKVQKLLPQDLDEYFASVEGIKLAKLFFELRTVTDNSVIENLAEQILSQTRFDSLRLSRELGRGSIGLRSEVNEFSEIPDSHIERTETAQLFSWVTGELKKDKSGKPLNFCLLAGNAGMGKTVIIKDLYDRLAFENIPVLGLKADKIASSSIKELQNKIGLPLPVYDFIEECKREFKTIVLVIDQIDALSQSMSADRSYLQVFKDLIDHYLYDSCVRIIVSVRVFDLHYDPSLRVYKDIDTITVSHLSEEHILEQLAKLGISKAMLSSKLLELFKTPNHLNVFSRIYAVNRTGLGFTTMQEMYQELWRQKVTGRPSNHPHTGSVKRLLYAMATKMFTTQQITVSEFAFEDYISEISYLESERMIKREERQLQFFHQSFYDFVFAKQFVENGNNFDTYIKQNGQSLRIRSAIKMILIYWRDYDFAGYIGVLTTIFEDNEILFHIKHMMLSVILFNENPVEKELKVVAGVISRSFHLCILFFELAQSENWLNFAIENQLFDLLNTPEKQITSTVNIVADELPILRKTCFYCLLAGIQKNYLNALKFASTLSDQSFIAQILYSVTDWNNPLCYKMFEGFTNFNIEDSFSYFHVLDNISKVNPKFALKHLADTLKEHHKRDGLEKDYEERDVLKTLVKSVPEQLFPVLFEVLITDFDRLDIGQHFISDYNYMSVDLADRESLSGRFYLYRLLAVCLRRSASLESGRSSVFLDFFHNNKSSRYLAVLRLLIFALRENEKKYPSEIFTLVNYLIAYEKQGLTEKLGIELRSLFERSFSHFSKMQQDIILTSIQHLNFKSEIFYRKKTEEQKAYINSNWGLTKYCWMKRLPIEVVEYNESIKREFGMLRRKFPKHEERERSGTVMAGIVGTPLPESAYEKMSTTQWLTSFKRYDGSAGRFERNFLRGDIDEHSSAFKSHVKRKPTPASLELIRLSIEDPSINPIYPLYGLWGWSESQKDLESIIPLFPQALAIASSKDLRRICLYIARNIFGLQKEDPSIVEFLVACALDFSPEPWEPASDEEGKETSIEGLITRGINSMSGSAAAALVHLQDNQYLELIFATLEKVLEEGPNYSRAILLSRFAYLMHFDQERVHGIFKRTLESEPDVYILASSIWSLHYIGNYDFESLRPIYEKLALSPILGREDSHSLFRILYGSHLFNKDGAEPLLHSLIEHNRHACANGINDILENYYKVPDSKEKNDRLLDFVLAKASEEDFEVIGWNFDKSLEIRLVDIAGFLSCYIRSRYFRLNDSLVEYLAQQSHQYPFEAIECFEIAIESNKFSSRASPRIRSSESATKFIVHALNALVANDDRSNLLRSRLLSAFDNILKDSRFRRNSERILDELIE